MPTLLTYLVIISPAAAFVINGVLVRWLLPARLGGGSGSRLSAYINFVAIGISLALSLYLLFEVVSQGNLETTVFNWVEISGLTLSFGVILDPLTVLMLVLVSGISLLIQIYSYKYMQGDKSYARFFTYMALFTASMLGLVSARNLVQVFIFWELVGLCSYLLISFWASRPSAVAAARKAFLMTRLGDFGFLVAMMYIAFINPEWLDITQLYGAVQAGLITAAMASWIVLGLLFGIVGKSAQLPLHAWLADAMEGPTPVSALLHSATMVTAGVFLIARLFPLFEHSNLQPLVAVIGLATAVLAATMAIASNDIKRVLAFSTVSQLGYITFALGIGAYAPAVFHIFIHAFFKAGLFMVAGNVGHVVHSFDMRRMGGLRRALPFTYLVAIICGLSLAALFPLSGFWSKDEIITFGFESGLGGSIGSITLLAVSVLTAFYTFRMIFLTFSGPPAEGDAEPAKGRFFSKLSRGESLWTSLPLLVVTLGAIVLGYLINPVGIALGAIGKHAFSSYITHNSLVFPDEAAIVAAGGEPHFSFIVAGISILSGVVGLVLAYFLYVSARKRTITRIFTRRPFSPLTNLFSRQYYFNELYEDKLIGSLFVSRFAKSLAEFETVVVDGAGDWVTKVVSVCGTFARKVQNGSAQLYAAFMVLGVALSFIIYFIVSAS